MTTFRLDNALPVDTTIPDPSLVCLIGAAGSGKSTWASTWPETQVLELDRFRALVSDDAGCHEATEDAAFALQAVLEARLARRKMTVVDATNSEEGVRANLVATARRHGVPTVALVIPTPASVCVERQAERPANRRVPLDVVRRQHADVAGAIPNLRNEGFDHVVLADRLHRLELLLRRVSGTRRPGPGWDGGGSPPELRAVHRFFGPEVGLLWRWHVGSHLAGGDRIGEIRLGPDRLVFALRSDTGGSFSFELLVACPADDDCDAPAWEPVHSVTDLLAAQTSATVCTVHGGPDRTGHRQGGDAFMKFRSA
ncbi:AAA family ATPase [Streptomyces chrestomyceticus]|uniref:AAA family ATPase n=1 Tax=Streptomyces chrestomyceticus TaxID=68185 RepID=UPI0035A8EA4E